MGIGKNSHKFINIWPYIKKLIALAKFGFKSFKGNKKIYYCFGYFVINFWYSRKL